MKKINRGLTNEDFQDIIKKGRYQTSKEFAVYFKKSDSDTTQIGVSVGKKIGNAVKRNKIKRQVKEMVNGYLTNLPVQNYIVLVRENYLSNDYQTNMKSLDKVLTKIIGG